MGFPLVPKSLQILRQMIYLTQLYEASDLPHEIINLPIDNVCSLSWSEYVGQN